MTAVLENVNKFSYLGLRRRPTYDEIIGLIKENDKLAGPLPNRDATFCKASNEGSFFDGLDSLEVLKEEQQRILQRQLQDLLLRQTVRANGGTFHMERHRQSSSSSDTNSSATSAGVQADNGEMIPAQIQTELQNISYSTNISRWNEQELEFQLYIRGTDVRDPENSIEGLRKKGKGKGLTNWQHMNNIAQSMIADGRWQRRVEAELLKKRITEYNQRQQPRGSKD